MPGLTYASGQADAVYPLAQLGHEIVRRVIQSRAPAVASQPSTYAVQELDRQ
jgi:hypothetical protein